MSESDLAERCGMSRSTIQRIERGDATVEIGLVLEAATVVGISLFDERQLADSGKTDSTTDFANRDSKLNSHPPDPPDHDF